MLLSLITGGLRVANQATENPAADRFVCLYWNDRRSAVRRANEMVTALNPCHLKSKRPERCNELLACDSRKSAHALTVTRCNPTKSRLGPASPSTSRQSGNGRNEVTLCISLHHYVKLPCHKSSAPDCTPLNPDDAVTVRRGLTRIRPTVVQPQSCRLRMG